jgi:hypothetical protein
LDINEKHYEIELKDFVEYNNDMNDSVLFFEDGYEESA